MMCGNKACILKQVSQHIGIRQFGHLQGLGNAPREVCKPIKQAPIFESFVGPVQSKNNYKKAVNHQDKRKQSSVSWIPVPRVSSKFLGISGLRIYTFTCATKQCLCEF